MHAVYKSVASCKIVAQCQFECTEKPKPKSLRSKPGAQGSLLMLGGQAAQFYCFLRLGSQIEAAPQVFDGEHHKEAEGGGGQTHNIETRRPEMREPSTWVVSVWIPISEPPRKVYPQTDSDSIAFSQVIKIEV